MVEIDADVTVWHTSRLAPDFAPVIEARKPASPEESDKAA
jgi:hypothetical protein